MLFDHLWNGDGNGINLQSVVMRITLVIVIIFKKIIDFCKIPLNVDDDEGGSGDDDDWLLLWFTKCFDIDRTIFSSQLGSKFNQITG